MLWAKLTVPSIGSTTQRYSADSSPASPSSPRSETSGNAACSFFSINFWQRTSSSSLMSCDVISFAFFSTLRFLRMIAPAAFAASTADASALFKGTVSISSRFHKIRQSAERRALLCAFTVISRRATLRAPRKIVASRIFHARKITLPAPSTLPARAPVLL